MDRDSIILNIIYFSYAHKSTSPETPEDKPTDDAGSQNQNILTGRVIAYIVFEYVLFQMSWVRACC